ncbi:MAG: aldo/keto reductase [Bryobacteraceae bacterium]|nr:aldo/keto reductase [Bryobacteraceae bacterium]
MDRRTFLGLSPVAAQALLADAPMPMATLGKSRLRVSKFTLGGYHMAVRGEAEAISIIHRAIDLGVNFFDSAHHYHQGRSDEIYGEALAGGRRQKVLLMSKAQLRDGTAAARQLDETLRRMKTDYLDLWQCHEVSTQEEVDRILAPGGALEAFVRAKKDGKARHIGFTGHRDPAVHARLLDAFDGWETVQMPVNLIDPHYLSFTTAVLPQVRKRGLGLLAMKTNAMGNIAKNGIATVAECLRYAWSQDVDTVVSGVESVAQLEENVLAAKTFRPMSGEEISAVLERTKKGKTGAQIEHYKRTNV